MRRLAEQDAGALLEVVAELDRLDDPLPFPPQFLKRLADLFGTTEACYCAFDRQNECLVHEATWCDGDELVEGSSEVLHRAAFWDEVYRHQGIDWPDMGLRPQEGVRRVFIFVHGSHDFGDRERLLLQLLEPHLERHASEVEAREAAAAALSAVEDAGDHADDIVLATARGTIEFASPRSRALLEHYLGVADGEVPEAILVGTTVASGDAGRLTIRPARVGDLVVLLLAEEDLRTRRLTRRQREVLTDVASGLTDAEIAEHLGVARATVSKHLEAIYQRLGVHNRTSAAALLRPHAN